MDHSMGASYQATLVVFRSAWDRFGHFCRMCLAPTHMSNRFASAGIRSKTLKAATLCTQTSRSQTLASKSPTIQSCRTATMPLGSRRAPSFCKFGRVAVPCTAFGRAQFKKCTIFVSILQARRGPALPRAQNEQLCFVGWPTSRHVEVYISFFA